MSRVWYDYDKAIDYLERKGIWCNPCTFAYDIDEEGQYVLDFLDENIDRLDENNYPHYRKSTLDRIAKEIMERHKRQEK